MLFRSEVAEAHGREPAVRTPGPVTNDRVDEAGDTDRVENVADEATAADHRARGDGGSGVSERVLEDPVGQQRNARRAVGLRQALQEEPVGADPGRTVLEHEREADRPEEDAADTLTPVGSVVLATNVVAP